MKKSSSKNYPVVLDDEKLKAELDPIEYSVLRKAATERPFTGKYTDEERSGIYRCNACSAELFTSKERLGIDS